MCYTSERGKGASAEMNGSAWGQNTKTIFLPIPDSLDALRRSTIQKLLAGASASRFVVTHEDDYLPDAYQVVTNIALDSYLDPMIYCICEKTAARFSKTLPIPYLNLTRHPC